MVLKPLVVGSHRKDDYDKPYGMTSFQTTVVNRFMKERPKELLIEKALHCIIEDISCQIKRKIAFLNNLLKLQCFFLLGIILEDEF